MSHDYLPINDKLVMRKYKTTLWTFLQSRAGNQLSLGERLHLARAVVAECARVDSNGLIHRDVKLSNFLLAKTSTKARWRKWKAGESDVCLTDFGLSRKFNESFPPAGTPGKGHDQTSLFEGI